MGRDTFAGSYYLMFCHPRSFSSSMMSLWKMNLNGPPGGRGLIQSCFKSTVGWRLQESIEVFEELNPEPLCLPARQYCSARAAPQRALSTHITPGGKQAYHQPVRRWGKSKALAPNDSRVQLECRKVYTLMEAKQPWTHWLTKHKKATYATPAKGYQQIQVLEHF